jgi:lipopolysaccharide/colanic/teichoic acid biosynthesis glycosyltransferase
VTKLEGIAKGGDPIEVKQQLHAIVPEYREPTAEELRLQPAPVTPDVQLPAATAPPPLAADAGERLRQWLDAAVAAVVLLAATPVWGLMVLEARLRGEREILLREVRVGQSRRRAQRRGKPANVSIDRRSLERRTQDLYGAPITCARFRSDLGPVSRWVARRRLDKLPWLLNVMRGEMALVGPKPEKEELVLRFQNLVPDYARRFSVLPGLTGLAQVSRIPDSEVDGVVRRVHYDLFYVDHRSLVLDLRTLVRTLGVVLRHPRGGELPGEAARARTAA